jgi:hypothetical protein
MDVVISNRCSPDLPEKSPRVHGLFEKVTKSPSTDVSPFLSSFQTQTPSLFRSIPLGRDEAEARRVIDAPKFPIGLLNLPL